MNVRVLNQNANTYIDTGSTITILSDKLFRRLRLNLIPNSSISVRQVHGYAHTLGRCMFPLTIANTTLNVEAHVIRNFHHPLLLGLDACYMFNLTIDVRKRRVYISHNHSHPSHSKTNTCFLSTANHSKQSKYQSTHLKHTNSHVEKILSQYPDIFSQNDTDIGITLAKHHIRTLDHPPISFRPYRFSIPDAKFVENIFEEI